VVVDDHPDTAHVMAVALKIEGFEVTTALDGKTGMLRVADDEPDVVLLYITLPDMSGVEVARRIRETTSRNIAIIAVTSLGFERDREKYRHAGFDAFCMKPVEISD
jgi:DNA-binding response OmpR family regulator